MKRILRISLVVAILALSAAFIVIFDGESRRASHKQTCTGLQVTVLDSAQMQFVTKEDVKQYIKSGYGVYLGQRLDSVNLHKIEDILSERSAILRSEAYLTGDGILHVEITQRAPILRFEPSSGSGFFADETGYLYPLVKGYSDGVTKVDGAVPVAYQDGYKGYARTEKERQWIMGMVGMEKWLDGNRTWKNGIKRISVNGKGGLVLYPAAGVERFYFGRPENYREKFGRIGLYYTRIAPASADKGYRYVDVSIDGQIICRKK